MNEYETGAGGYRYHDQTITVSESYETARTIVGDVAYLIGRTIRLVTILAVVAVAYIWLAPAGLKAACQELVTMIGALL